MMILSLFPADLKQFLSEVEEIGARLCLVGGGSRDFLREGTLSNDLDFEVRGVEISTLKSFFKKRGLTYTELPYDIVRLDFKGFDLEFSSPRLENPLTGNKTHHHFEVVLDKELSYDRAFARRDFTLNAIGIEFNFTQDEARVVDPYKGVQDLEEKTLREISDYFFLDSVRFLRLVRFQVKYGFKISESIKNQMGLFDLSELSLHHFKSEMKKSKKAGAFINEFSTLVKDYHLPVKDVYKIWKNIHFSPELETAEDLLVSVFLKDPGAAKEVAVFFSMPDKVLKDLKSFYDSYQAILKLKKEDLIPLCQSEMDAPEVMVVLRDLKNLEDKKEWKRYFPSHLIISWDDWADECVDAELLQATPAPLRSYLRFYQTMKRVIQ